MAGSWPRPVLEGPHHRAAPRPAMTQSEVTQYSQGLSADFAILQI